MEWFHEASAWYSFRDPISCIEYGYVQFYDGGWQCEAFAPDGSRHMDVRPDLDSAKSWVEGVVDRG